MFQKHQPPDWDYKNGYSEILENSLYVCGEDDLDELFYGEEEARNINGKGQFKHQPQPIVDIWIDLRDLRKNNRKLFIPNNVKLFSVPFKDGDLIAAKEYLPKALCILKNELSQEKKVVISCHEGKSRSMILLLWFLSEKFNSFYDALLHLQSKRPIMSIDKKFLPISKQLEKTYQKSNLDF